MIAIAPTSTHHLWVLADTSRSALEILGVTAAVIGVLLWAGGLAWLVLSDVFRATHHPHKHDDQKSGTDTDHPSH